MTIKVDSDNLKEGLLGLVIALVEIIKDVLQKQAVHRIESNSLREEEGEKLGLAFMKLDETLEKIKKENNLEKTADKIRADLDGLVDDALMKLIDPLLLEAQNPQKMEFSGAQGNKVSSAPKIAERFFSVSKTRGF